MKKWLSILIVGIFIVSGFGTVATNVSNTGTLSIQTRTDTVSVDVSSIQVTESANDYLLVRLGEQESYLLNPGQPMIPRIIKHYELPFGVTNVQVEAQPLMIQEQVVAKQIRPAPSPVCTHKTHRLLRTLRKTARCTPVMHCILMRGLVFMSGAV